MRDANSTAEPAPLPGTPLNPADVRRRAAGLVADDLVIMPVRHHSPACSLHLQRLIDRLRPSVVLVEGPHSFDRHIEHLTHTGAVAPFAIYTYSVQRSDDGAPRRQAGFYPFCDYSPELVALRAAASLGVPVRFIDLELEQHSQQEHRVDEQWSLMEEHRYAASQRLRGVAAALGCRDTDEMWDHLIESPAVQMETDELLARVMTYCMLTRADTSELEMELDGTLQREQEMAGHIGEALRARGAGDGPVLAVVGGFHAVVLRELVDRGVPRPTLPARGALLDHGSAIVRYGFRQLDRLNGYAAGMTSPQWYQMLWEAHLGAPVSSGGDGPLESRTDVALHAIFDIAEALRRDGDTAVPAPTVQAAYEQAVRLAGLRDRLTPSRTDVVDAITGSLVKGDVDGEGASVLAVATQVLCGDRVGTLPPGVPVPPIVRDFETRLHRHRLKGDSVSSRDLHLEIYRRDDHRQTSHFLHRLEFLRVPFGQRVAGPDFVRGIGLDRIIERWQYVRSPMTDGALVEAAVYGQTVERAAAARFAEMVEAAHGSGLSVGAGEAASWVVQALVLGLHHEVPALLGGVAAAVGADPTLTSVVAAASTLAALGRSGEPFGVDDGSQFAPVLRAAFTRAIFLCEQARGAANAAALADSLVRLREVATAAPELDSEILWAAVERLADEHDQALVRGAAMGLLYQERRADVQDLARRFTGVLDGALDAGDAVAFAEGLLRVAREIAWQEPAFVAALDRSLTAWDDGTFVALLPRLRLAFASLTPGETDRVAASVGSLLGADLGPLVQRNVSASDVQRGLELTGRLRAVLADDLLADWIETPA